MYVNSFAKTLSGLEGRLDYVQECNVNYLHLMPLLASPKGRSDGGYAVSDFRSVQPELGTMDEFSHLTSECHKRGISVCLDFVMNHTSEEHEWQSVPAPGKKNIRIVISSLIPMIFLRFMKKPVLEVIPHPLLRKLYLAGRYPEACYDYFLSLPVGSELPQSCSS